MKKLSYLVLSFLLVLSCGLFAACGTTEEGSIALSASNVSIFLGETENNTVVVNALPKNLQVNYLDIVYDTTYIRVVQGEKLTDDSFNLFVESKISDFGTTAPISVEVKAGDVSAVFYVELVLPVQSIQPKSDAVVAYDGSKTSFYLPNCITFEPASTKQTGVEFSLAQESAFAHIEGNYLIIDSNAQVNFNDGEIPFVKVNVVSTVEGKSSVGAEFNVKIVPNIQLLADLIDIRLNYNGADNVVLENQDYELIITPNADGNGYSIQPFSVKISIPTALGIEVEVDSEYTQNILNYLTYSKEITKNTSNPANVLDVYTFYFDANTAMQGEGFLRFNYKYTNYSDNQNLSSTFVGMASDDTLLERVKISVLMPIDGIEVITDCSITNDEQYIIYQNYQDGIKGSTISFVATPHGTAQKGLILVKPENSSLVLCDTREQVLNFEFNEVLSRYECHIQSNDIIFVKGGDLAQEILTCYSDVPGNEGISKTIIFSVQKGGSGLCFVNDFNEDSGLENKTVYMQYQNPTTTLIYSPGSELKDFIYNGNKIVLTNPQENYFEVTFKTDLEIGEHILTISTVNGYSIQAIVKVIEHISEVNVVLGDNTSHISGVGYTLIKDNNIVNLGLENGYSAKLNYITNQGAKVSRVEYSFYEPNINVYDNRVQKLKDVTIENYETVNGIQEFVEASSYISTQNLNLMNLLTATATGVVVIKINIYGQVVETGNVHEEIVATKYLFVEVYNPIKKIESSAKNITLRALNQLDSSDAHLASTTIDMSVLSNDVVATYDKIFIDLGKYEVVEGKNGEEDTITSTFTKTISGKEVFKAIYDYNAKTLTINVSYVDATIAATTQKFTLFAGDFVNIITNGLVNKEELTNYNLKTFDINLTILETTVANDISVSNLTLVSETQNVYNDDGTLKERGVKTYSTVYIDTSKGASVIYKLYTEVLPFTALNKDLNFVFNPNSGYSQAMIDIANDGTLTILSKQGGAGVIEITSADTHSTARTVRVPIVVADGNSWETAYEITSLNQIVDPNKHYVLTNPTIYLLENTILKDFTFNGGLYGKRYNDESNNYATIKLTGEPLFVNLGLSAEVRCLNLCGDVNSIEKDFNGAKSNNGFVAYENKGMVSDVKITTFVNENGVYVPSTLFVASCDSAVGGFVGKNEGNIQNSTFAGSINITNANVAIKANAFAGNTVVDGVKNCNVVIAKFSELVPANRVVADTDNDRKNKTETVYVNGIVDNRAGSPRTNSLFDDITNVDKKRYDGEMYVLDKNIYIKDTFTIENLLQTQKHSYGEANSLFGLIFYYKAANSANQSMLEEFNVISFEDLFDFANLGDDHAQKSLVARQLKVSALNPDGTVCSFVNVGATSLELNGIGEFIIRITSEYDYTIIFEIKLLSIYYSSNFSINYNGADLEKEDTLQIIYNQTREIVSSLNNKIVYNGKAIELCANDFAILFSMKQDGVDIENTSDYITSNKLGIHTINMKFDTNKTYSVYANLDAGYSNEYNLMLNKIFGLILDGQQKKLFNIQRKYGTTNISTNLTDGSIEPNAPFVFEATLATDMQEDYIAKLDNTNVLKGISIYNQFNYDCTDYFNINVKEIDIDKKIYEIQISLNMDAFYGEEAINIMNYVNRQYTVIINAFNSVGGESQKYSAFASVNFTLLPQTITNINTSLYNVTSSTITGVSVNEHETTTSVILPSESGLFVVDMFPSYASYDYLEIVATSDTMAKLTYRLEEYDPIVLEEFEDNTIGWISNFRTVTNNIDKDGNKIYEAITDKNGIRVYNNANYNQDFYNSYAEKYDDREHLNNVNNIGKYFIKIFADNSFDTDTIFTITVKAYLNGQVLTAQSSFTLYMRMPEAPQLTIDGQTKVYKLIGQEIIADVLVANDQIDFSANFARAEEDYTLSVLDHKSVENLTLSCWQVSENNVVGYKRYKISIEFEDTYDYKIDTTQIKLVVQTTKIFNGKSIKVTSDVFVYLVDYLPEQNDIKIFDSAEGIFNITSLKPTELKLANLSNVNATKDFIDAFNQNYYYPVLDKNNLENTTGFVFGKNIFEEFNIYNNSYVLASYLSYVNNNQKTALLRYYFDDKGELKFDFNKDDLNRVRFDWKYDENGEVIGIIAQGGDTTGRVEMSLDIQYKMPDNRYYTYEYRFTIVNSLYTTEDLPIEIANNADFIDIQNNDTAYDYILTKDLNLYDFTTIANTDKIKSLDGNNHTINIWNFAKVETGTATHALFNQISSLTTIKNLTINLYYLSEIEFGTNVTNAQVAGLAITNNGAIYNCEVLAYKSTTNTSGSSVLGIKMSKDIEATVAGFVINNYGSITNSRVGGESKLVTSIEYIEDENGIVTKRNVTEQILLTKQLAIQASGTVSGFVIENSGVIASSFVKNISIQNTYYKQETRVTTGFVNTNSGTIAMCYTEGGFASQEEIQASIGGIEGVGIMSGFVYRNNGNITDSYSNLMITNNRDQVGRLGSGFVFENAENGVIERAYSASKVISNNITQMNFAGIKDFGGYNNNGKISKSYYYIPNSSDELAIESIFNTDISSISDMLKEKNFYGFSFKRKINDGKWNDGTWINSTHGPTLISPNHIAHSLRAKYEKPDSVQSELNYIFEYCEGYELGSANNPIIIRDAHEFNSVLGGSSSTDIKANYSNGKIFGAYRLVNHIDLIELVPEDEKDSEYKVNLISTQMMLTGEYAESTNRPGTIDGNGLSINNLAISNSSTQSDGFGLFKSIENNASIANLNITLSSGGVTADHTVFVGALAGSLIDSNAYNITATALVGTKVIGSNVVGGLFGRVVGQSSLSNIEIENLSVTATYNSTLTNTTVDSIIINTENLYIRKDGIYTNLSIVGGVAGVVDIYDKKQYESTTSYTEQSLQTTIQSISFAGGFVVEGMCAGGLFGYIGEYVSAKDLLLTVTKNEEIDAKILAYNHFAGGIAGYSEGYLYQLRSEHETSWQTEIEQNYHSYYTSQDRLNIDRGNEKMFMSDVGYRQIAVGGLVGVVNGGKVTVGYSKLNVETNAEFSGGVFGYISSEYLAGNNENASRSPLSLTEIYASGDVYSDYANARIGGLIGYISDPNNSATIEKLNAVNYWSEKSASLFVNNNGSHEFSCYVEPLGHGKKIAPIANADGAVVTQRVNGEGELVDRETVLSIRGIQFAGEEAKIFKTVNASSMQSYYDYSGVTSDNGAQVDLMFKNNGWYNDNNWTRFTLEALPHIKFLYNNTAYIIQTVDDFRYFSEHGSEEDAIFVIDGIERDLGNNQTTKLIDCKSVLKEYPIIRGTIIGATNEDGFENLNISLFKKTSGALITNLKFKSCNAPLVKEAISTSFKSIYYTDCNFAICENDSTAGIAYTVVGLNTEFNSITFDEECSLTAISASDAGFLFAKTGTSSQATTIKISNIVIENKGSNSFIVNKSYNQADLNYGLLFGRAYCEVNVDSAMIYDNMKVNISSTGLNNLNDVAHEINIGLIAGYVHKLNTTMSEVKLFQEKENLGDPNNGLQITGASSSYGCNVTFNIGGLLGSSNELSVSASRDENSNSRTIVYFAPTISVQGMKNAQSLKLGSLGGNVGTLTLNNYALYIFGQKQIQTDKGKETKFVELTYDMAEGYANEIGLNYIGGLVGSLQSLEVTQIDSQNIEEQPLIAYYGDIKVKDPQKEKTKLALGGLFGIVGMADKKSTVKNVFFDGTIGFSKKLPDVLYLGGLIGYIEKDATVESYNAVSSGEILIKSANNQEDNGLTQSDVQLTGTRYAGGLVGFVDGALQMGNITPLKYEGDEKDYFYTAASITTIFTTQRYDNVDAIANISKDNGSFYAKTFDGENISSAQYSSTLTLSTSKLSHDKSNGENKYVTNYPYESIKVTYTQGNVVRLNTVFDAVGGEATYMGTKLNPYILANEGAVNLPKYSVDETPTDEQFFAQVSKDEEQLSYNMTSISKRKLYVYVADDVKWIKKQLSLTNTILFGDGKAIYSGITPINIIDNNSAVSGVIAKVYIDSEAKSATTDPDYADFYHTEKDIYFGGILHHYAGFVNENYGIIYTCSAQECMNDTKITDKAIMNNSTQFYGYFLNKRETKSIFNQESKLTGYAGFVGYNDGYIFGSNSNMLFATENSLPVSGFVANNSKTGVISYCYASGENYYNTSETDKEENNIGNLFAPKTTAVYKYGDVEDFAYWIGEPEVDDNQEYRNFWNKIKGLVEVEKTKDQITGEEIYQYSDQDNKFDWEAWLSGEGANNYIRGYDFDNWGYIVNSYDEENNPLTTNIDQVIKIYWNTIANNVDASGNPIKDENGNPLFDEEGNPVEGLLSPYYSASLALFSDIYNIEIAPNDGIGDPYVKHNNNGEKIPTFLGTYENCYTIVMAKGTFMSNLLPNSVYGESLSNEIQISGNDTKLFSFISGSALLDADTSGYYNCHPDYNWCYPTLTGDMFRHFDFLKRSTLCVEVEDKEKTVETINYTSKNDPSVKFGDTPVQEIERNTIDVDDPINEYFEKDFYVQIPNLTVLQNLQGYIEGMSFGQSQTYKFKYSKFVVIANMNFGIDVKLNDGENTYKLLEKHSFIMEVDASQAATNVIIDGYNRSFSNMSIVDDIESDTRTHFINEIKAGNEGKTVEVRRFKFENITLNQSTGIIGKINKNVIFNYINFPQTGVINYSAPNRVFDGGNFIGILTNKNYGKISNCSFASSIQAIGKQETIRIVNNSGKVTEYSSIKVGNSEQDYILGGYAGINQGIILNCSFSGKVQIIEKNLKISDNGNVTGYINVTFGCFAGQNGDGVLEPGTIEACQLKQGSTNTYYLSEGGSIYFDVNDEKAYYDKIITIEQNDEKIRSEIKAQIYVSTLNEATVGGIVGIQKYGSVFKCVTFASPVPEEGDTVDYLGILVGNEETQMKSIAGGIVGEQKGGTVKDSANRMNISALSVWLFTTTSQTDYRYRVEEIPAGTKVTLNSAKTDKQLIEEKELRVSYLDASPNPIFKYDDKGTLYVYNEMTSLAYAGGIVGFGMFGSVNDEYHDLAWENAEENELLSNKLANYGTIKGGYRAIKPTALITATVQDTESAAWGFYGSFATAVGLGVAGGISLGRLLSSFKEGGAGVWNSYIMGVSVFWLLLGKILKSGAKEFAKALLKAGAFWWKYLALAGSAVSFGVAASIYANAIDLATSPTFTTKAIIGNSLNYYKDTNFVKLICNNNDGFNNQDIKKQIANAVITDGSSGSAVGDYQSFVGENVIGALTIAFGIGSLVIGNSFKNGAYNVNFVSTIDQAVSYTSYIEEHLGTENDFINLNKLLGINNALKSYAYDGICSTIHKYGKTYNVYSSVPNYDTDETDNTLKTLHSGNIENSKVVYSNINAIYNQLENVSVENWGENFGVDEYGNVVPNIGLKQEKNPENNDDIISGSKDVAVYTVKAASDWEDIVYTINLRSLGQNKENYLNAIININLSGGQTVLDIEDNTFNRFDGIINSNLQYKITNIILSNNEKSNNYGLIKETGGAELYNLNISGEINISKISQHDKNDDNLEIINQDKQDSQINGGILIGKVVDISKTVKLKNINLDISNINFDGKALSLTSNFGGMIGKIDSDESPEMVNISDITINTSFKASTSATIAGDTTESDNTNNGFAAVIGSINACSNVSMEKFKINGDIELGTNFNRVGSVVGYIGEQGVFSIVSVNFENIPTIDMAVKAASRANTSVGGIIGYNEGICNLGLINLATQKSLLVTADVMSFEYYATAGGIIGFNKGNALNYEFIIMGKSLSSYADIGYVFAGYNMVEFTDVATSFPKQQGTSAGIAIGNDETSTTALSQNIIAKFIASDISKSEDLAKHFKDNFIGNEFIKAEEWNKIVDKIDEMTPSNELKLDRSKVKVQDNAFVLSYNIKNETKNQETGELLNSKSKNGTYKLKYLFNKVEDFGIISSDNNTKAYEWLLKVHYEAETSEDNIPTSKMIDDKGQESNKISIDYNFIIRLVSANAKVDDNGVYILQVIKLNDYIKTKKLITGDAFSSDDLELTPEEDSEMVKNNIYNLVTYKYDLQFVPKVIYSAKIRMNEESKEDYSSLFATIQNAMDIDLIFMVAESKTDGVPSYDPNMSKPGDDHKISSSSKSSKFTISTDSFGIGLKKDGQNWKFAMLSNFDLEVSTNSSSSESTVGDITKEDEGNISDEDYGKQNGNEATSTNNKTSKSIIMFEQTILNTDVPSENIDISGAPSSTFKVTLNGNNIKLQGGGNAYKNNDYELIYAGDFKVGEHIGVSYITPKFEYTYNGNKIVYDKVVSCAVTIEKNNYVIISCLDEGEARVDEYVFLVQNNMLYTCGYITYNVSSLKTSTTNSFDIIVKANRHASFFPNEKDEQVISNQVLINNVQSFTTKPDTSKSQIEFNYIYHSTEVNITTNTEWLFYCNIEKITKKNTCLLTFKYENGKCVATFITNNISTKITDTKSNKVYYSSIKIDDELRNIINIESISTGYGISDNPSAGNVSELISNQQNGHTYTINHCYVFKGKIIGFVYTDTWEEKRITIDGNGDKIETVIPYILCKAKFDVNGTNNFKDALSVANIQTNPQNETIDMEILFSVSQGTNPNGTLTAS